MANGHPNTASFGLGFIGAVLIFCAFAAVAWLLFSFSSTLQPNEDKRAQNREDKSAAIAQEAQDKLYSPAKWIDKSKGTVQLPIDTAMDLVVADYQAKSVHASEVKVEDPYPFGLKSITPGFEAAPAATGTAAITGTAATTGTAAPVAKPATAASPTPEVKS